MAFLTDGYQTLISFGARPDANTVFKEKEVQPPDTDAGGEVDTTTMRNARFRTRQPKHLVTLGRVKLMVQYDSAIYPFITAAPQQGVGGGLLGNNNLITITFPDAHTLAFWGFIDKFTPPSHKEGEFPIAEIDIVCSNQDNTGTEQAPVYN